MRSSVPLGRGRLYFVPGTKVPGYFQSSPWDELNSVSGTLETSLEIGA